MELLPVVDAVPTCAPGVRASLRRSAAPWCSSQDGVGYSPATIDRRLVGAVVTSRRQHQLQLPVDVAEEARALLKATAKALEKYGEIRGRGLAPALLVRDTEMIAPTPSQLPMISSPRAHPPSATGSWTPPGTSISMTTAK